MVRFEKTRIHPASAVLVLLGLYGLAGAAYAAFLRSIDSVVIWIAIAALAFVASAVYQRHVTKKRRPAQ